MIPTMLSAFVLVSTVAVASSGSIIIDIMADRAKEDADSSSTQHEQQRRHRRRRLGSESRPMKRDHREQALLSDDAEIQRNKDFYDVSEMTEDEKLDMIKTAYSLFAYGNDIDWDVQRNNFVQTVLQSRNHHRQNDNDNIIDGQLENNGDEEDIIAKKKYHNGNDDAYDGQTDDALKGDILDIVTTVMMTGGNDDDTLHRNSFVKEKAVDGNDDAYDGKTDDTLSSTTVERAKVTNDLQPDYLQPPSPLQTTSHNSEHLQQSSSSSSTHRRLQSLNNIDGDVFGAYEYTKGACPKDGSLGVPCAPDDISATCNKYDRANGSLKECINVCKPAFCCIHDAPRALNYLAPNCNTDENCAQYNYCYIAWWKLHDTVGPALFLRVEQDDDFFDIDADEIQGDNTGDELFTQVLLHHFDDINAVIADGTVDNEFNADRIFLDEDYWLYPEAGKVEID